MDDFGTTRLRPLAAGLILALLAIAFGWGLGGVFGAAEDTVKGMLSDSGQAVLATTYAGDTDAMDKVVNKSWSYLKRAHLHGGVLGASSVTLILLLALLGTPTRLTRVAAGLLGGGSLGYGLYWLLAGFLAPGLGGTGAAKDALELLAVPSAGALLVGLGLTAYLTLRAMYRPN